MDSNRKAEVNRLLAEFECQSDEHRHLVKIFGQADYASDLNALARLEAKLPPHKWEIHYIGNADGSPSGDLLAEAYWNLEKYTKSHITHIEAEARAEVIAQYLEQR